MSARKTQVIDLGEYRRRRLSRNVHSNPPVESMMWCPVWVMVPVWYFR
jgi:hypothetical protein